MVPKARAKNCGRPMTLLSDRAGAVSDGIEFICGSKCSGGLLGRLAKSKRLRRSVAQLLRQLEGAALLQIEIHHDSGEQS